MTVITLNLWEILAIVVAEVAFLYVVLTAITNLIWTKWERRAETKKGKKGGKKDASRVDADKPRST